jgi:hypothetical protein
VQYFTYYVEKAERNIPFGKPKHRCDNSINLYLKDMRLCELVQAVALLTCTPRNAMSEYQPGL